MKITTEQIQTIQDELDRALSMERKIAGHQHSSELSTPAYARWVYWNGKAEQAKSILAILGL